MQSEIVCAGLGVGIGTITSEVGYVYSIQGKEDDKRTDVKTKAPHALGWGIHFKHLCLGLVVV